MKIDIWTDIVCPFCYIGMTQFTKALEDFDHKKQVNVLHHSFQLTPDAPDTLTGKKAYEALAERKGQPVEAMKNSFAQVAEKGKEEGLTMNMLDTELINTFNAHQLIHFAATHDKQEEAVTALYEAYFTDAADITSKEVLMEIAEKLGLDKGALANALEENKYADSVNADIQQAADLGIQGVPFFVIDGTFGISGAQGTDAFSSALNQAWKASHPLHMMNADTTAAVCKDGACV